MIDTKRMRETAEKVRVDRYAKSTAAAALVSAADSLDKQAALVEKLKAALRAAHDDIYWMSAASDFAPEGQAELGWAKVRARLVERERLLENPNG